eukprot:g7271.t1
MAAGEKHHFCTTAWARLSIDISYLVGLKVPHVATLGWHTSLHAGPGLQWRAGPLAARKTAFVPRNVLTRRVQGQLFAAMLGHFNQLPWVQSAGIEVEVWQGGFESINRDAGDPWRGQAHGRIWWSDALYAMQVPTLVPEIGWQARIMADMCNTGIGWFFKHSPLYNLPEGEETLGISRGIEPGLLPLTPRGQVAPAGGRGAHVQRCRGGASGFSAAHLAQDASFANAKANATRATKRASRGDDEAKDFGAGQVALGAARWMGRGGRGSALGDLVRKALGVRTTQTSLLSQMRSSMLKLAWYSLAWINVPALELSPAYNFAYFIQSFYQERSVEELATGTISIRGPFDDTVLQTLGLRQNGMNWFDEVTEVLVLGLQVLALGRSFKCSGQ